MDKGGGREEVSRFSVKKFLSHSAEIFVKEPFSVSLISDIEKCYGKIIKIFGSTETRTSDLLLENPVVLTLLLSFIFE